MNQNYDAIVIGTGQAGPSLATHLASEGYKVAIIERGRFGGTCVNTGCIPTKTMVACARAAHVVRHAENYGVITGGRISVDMKKIKTIKDKISGESNKNIEKWLKSTDNVTVYHGHARFESEKSVSVGKNILQADNIFINVGGRANIPEFPGLGQIDYLDNSSIMEIDLVPEHLVVVGGGYIGLEFAQMFKRYGSEVTIIEKGDRLLKREDRDVSESIKNIFEKDGINIRLNAECISFCKDGGIIEVGLNCSTGDNNKVRGTHILTAVGRIPNTDDLGLEKAGIETDSRGFVIVDNKLRTNINNIYALGDCNGRGAFTHTSYNDYEIVISNFIERGERTLDDRIECYGLFIDPPLGRAGMTEDAVRKSGRKALIGKRLMTRVGRARERGETEGFIKILVDAETKQILGSAIIGIEGDEAIHCILDIMYSKQPYTVIKNAVHIHPTVSELIPTVLGELKPFN